jgi:hypothetical protein
MVEMEALKLVLHQTVSPVFLQEVVVVDLDVWEE